MKFRILSDLHLDFHRDGGESLIREISTLDYDVLIVAGDISGGAKLQESLDLLMGYTVSDVVYVPGNHDYYGSSWKETRRVLDSMERIHHRLTVLDQKDVTVDGFHIVGATLWFPYDGPTHWDSALSDFHCILDIRSWIGKYAVEVRSWLDRIVTPESIVVTHHMPHVGSIDPQYASSPLNRFFLHSVGDELVGRPRLWVHGHTHTSADYRVKSCRVVCNPFGYVGHPAEPNSAFRSDFDIEM